MFGAYCGLPLSKLGFGTEMSGVPCPGPSFLYFRSRCMIFIAIFLSRAAWRCCLEFGSVAHSTWFQEVGDPASLPCPKFPGWLDP